MKKGKNSKDRIHIDNYKIENLKYKTFTLKKAFIEIKNEINKLEYIKIQLLNNNYCLKCLHKHNPDKSCIETIIFNFFSSFNINFGNYMNLIIDIFDHYNHDFISNLKYENYNFPTINNINDINENNKIKNMIISLKKDILCKKRCLIFSDNNYFFKIIKLELDKHQISNRALKVNTNTINSIIKKYKNHYINVLLLNMKHCGSGINLEMSDNIYIMNYLDSETETEVIGRVNHIGKINNLNVNYYLTTNEYNHYKNIISSDTKSNIIIEEI